MDATHDPALASWVPGAESGASDFPIQNLPHGVCERPREGRRGVVAIGPWVLDLVAALATGAFDDEPEALRTALRAASAPALNGFMGLGQPAWRGVRRLLSMALARGSRQAERLSRCLVPQSDVTMALPARIGDYTDFFTSRDHMLNLGRLFQPGREELPQFASLPIAYHGRASTVRPSPAGPRRPCGQRPPRGAEGPSHGPTQALDYELELAAWVGTANALGEPVSIAEADARLFGIGLLNDWSARDLQAWEAMPLGPFGAKNFLTTVSPWVVTMEALAPFRVPVRRDADDPPLLPYLQPPDGADLGLDVTLEAWLEPAQGGAPLRLTRSRARDGHWSFAQMLVQHTVGGCSLLPGDLLGSGTLSGPGDGAKACLMEITRGGQAPLVLPGGGERRQLEDGDTLVLRAWAERPGAVRIGLGSCRGTVAPAG